MSILDPAQGYAIVNGVHTHLHASLEKWVSLSALSRLSLSSMLTVLCMW